MRTAITRVPKDSRRLTDGKCVCDLGNRGAGADTGNMREAYFRTSALK